MASFSPHLLRCKSLFDISGDSTYLFELAAPKISPSSRDNSIIAATASNNVIKIYSRETLQPQGLLNGHKSSVTGLSFSHTNPALLLSCSNDKTVRLWDLRSSDTSVQIFKSKPRTPLCNFDINCTDTIIAAGGELVEEDAFLFFWDIRSTKPLDKFSESHNDDITQVKFHPSNAQQLTTGSTDGLVCVHDITVLNEDESVVSILNSESSVATLGYFGPKYEFLYCLTHTETFHVWNALEANLLSNQKNIRDTLKTAHNIQVDYLVDCTYDEATQRLFIISGDHKGVLYVCHANIGSVTPVECLGNGHRATVRCANWNHQMGSIVTGGEDALLCHWQVENSIGPVSSSTTEKLISNKDTSDIKDTSSVTDN